MVYMIHYTVGRKVQSTTWCPGSLICRNFQSTTWCTWFITLCEGTLKVQHGVHGLLHCRKERSKYHMVYMVDYTYEGTFKVQHGVHGSLKRQHGVHGSLHCRNVQSKTWCTWFNTLKEGTFKVHGVHGSLHYRKERSKYNMVHMVHSSVGRNVQSKTWCTWFITL